MKKLTTAQKALLELNEKAVAFAKDEIEITDPLDPFMVLLLKNGDTGLADVSMLFRKEMEPMKRQVLKYILWQTKAVAFILASEAWFAMYTEEQVNDPNRRQPRDRDDRQEMLLISSEHIEGYWTMATFEIHRDEGNKRTINLSKPHRAEAGKGFDGREGELVNLFEGI